MINHPKPTKKELEAFERKAVIVWLRREADRLQDMTGIDPVNQEKAIAGIVFMNAARKIREAAWELEYGEHLKIDPEGRSR